MAMCEVKCLDCANEWADNGNVHICPKCKREPAHLIRWSDEANEVDNDYGDGGANDSE